MLYRQNAHKLKLAEMKVTREPTFSTAIADVYNSILPFVGVIDLADVCLIFASGSIRLFSKEERDVLMLGQTSISIKLNGAN